MLYDVFEAGGPYGWRSMGRCETVEEAAQISGHPMEWRSVYAYNYQDKSPLGRAFDNESRYERMVIKGMVCMSDAVATHDGLVKGVRVTGFFPVAAV